MEGGGRGGVWSRGFVIPKVDPEECPNETCEEVWRGVREV